jgi:predicted outer membrane repeat protein
MKPRLPHYRFPFVLITFCLLCLGALIYARPVKADGILIPASNRVDGVFSADNSVVYITSGSQVLRYDLSTQSFLAPLELGGYLKALDLSPDGQTLAIADSGDWAGDQLWVYVVRLDTGTSKKVTFARSAMEGGSYSIAYGSDGQLLITSLFQGSGWVPMRRYDPATDTTALLGQVFGGALLSASGDRSVIGYAEAGGSNGPWGRYFVATGNRLEAGQTLWFVSDIAANRNAAQFAITTNGGTFLYDEAANQVATLGSYGAGRPIGVAYHPTQDLLYTAWMGTSEIRVFETANFQQVDSLNAGFIFQDNHNWAFDNGRLKTSRDGALLLATVGGGVRVLRTDAARTQTSLGASSNPITVGNPVTLTATVQRLVPATGTPAGVVTFYESNPYGSAASLGSDILDDAGEAAITVTLPRGAHELTATFEGSLEDRSSDASPISLQVAPAGTCGVSVCDEAHLRTELDACDTITFTCSGTITLTATIDITANTTIDGSGQNVIISGNHAVEVFNANAGVTLSLNKLTIADGKAASDFPSGYGGGIHNSGTLVVNYSTLSGNGDSYNGGGIYSTGTLTVSNSIFSGNGSGTHHGGAIYSGGTATVSNSTFSGNSASSLGAGIFNFGSMIVSNSTFSGNTTFGFGGGLFNTDTGTAEVINSTFSGNSAGASGRGGGICNNQSSSAIILRNTIIANSPAGGNCSDLITDGGGNLSYPDATCPGINSNPMLGPLQNNGGPTQTIALRPGSAAVDAANDAICASPSVNNLDQRGMTRPEGPHCDIGAYEAKFSYTFLPIIVK